MRVLPVSKLVFNIGVVIASIFLWFLVKSELANYASIALAFLAALLSLAEWIKRRKRQWAILLVASVFIIVAMILLLYKASAEADDLANIIISEGNCVLLFSQRSGWVDNGSYLQRDVSVFGATRRLTYQKNGLFRYGFLHDSKRTVWLEACTESVN